MSNNILFLDNLSNNSVITRPYSSQQEVKFIKEENEFEGLDKMLVIYSFVKRMNDKTDCVMERIKRNHPNLFN